MPLYRATRKIEDVIVFDALNDAEAQRKASTPLDEVRFYGVMGGTWEQPPAISVVVESKKEKTE